jgi:signal transduction histidine kinase
MSHDLRNILATAQLISDSIAQSSDPAVRKVTPTLVNAIDRAVDLCSHTLRFVRSQDAPLRRMDFDLGELIDDLSGSLGLPMDGSITWNNQVPPGFEVNADRDELFRAILNLSRNAVQAVQGMAGNDEQQVPDDWRGEVSISAVRHETGVDIDFTDNGHGIPEEAREKLFKAFSGSAKIGGSGLGLAIANDIARAHEGTLELMATSTAGTRFRLHLPQS